MEIFLNIAVIWFVVGFAFFLLEFLVPGFILFFFGVGAWTVAIVTLFVDLSVNSQLILFLVISVLTVLLLRKWTKEKLGMHKAAPQILEDEFIGKTAVAETDIYPHKNGKVEFKGTSWDAHSDDHITAGENVTITGNQSILLIVKSKKIA